MEYEFNKKNSLDYLLMMANQFNIPQNKLCDGIYDYSHFNRMCNGKENIKLDVLLHCAQNASIPIVDVWNRGIYKDFDLYQYYFKQFYNNMEHFQLDRIIEICEELYQFNLNEDSYLLQLRYYINAIILMTEKKYIQAQNEIIFGIQCLHREFEISLNTKMEFSFIEKLMLVDLMTIYRYIKEYDKALTLFNIISRYNDSNYINAILVSTISPVFRADNKFYEAQQLLKESIDKCLEHYDIRQLGISYLELAHCCYEIKDVKQYEEYLIKSKTIYTLTNQIEDFYNEKALNYVCIQKDDSLFCFDSCFQFDMIR